MMFTDKSRMSVLAAGALSVVALVATTAMLQSPSPTHLVAVPAGFDDPVVDTDDDGDDRRARADGARRFTVTVENVSTPGLLTTDRARGAVPLSPGAFAVFEGDDDPAFTLDEMADSGTRLIAEDGFPAPRPFIEDDTEVEILRRTEGVLEAGAFAAPGGTPEKPAIFPGETATFSFTASPGQRLQIETMFVQSNDWFYAFGDGGLELFRRGEPVEGDVTDELLLYDAGTEVDAPPGEGPTEPPGAVQKPVQPPRGTEIGTDEEEVIQLVRERFPDFDVPDNDEVIRVSITSSAADDDGFGGDLSQLDDQQLLDLLRDVVDELRARSDGEDAFTDQTRNDGASSQDEDFGN